MYLEATKCDRIAANPNISPHLSVPSMERFDKIAPPSALSTSPQNTTVVILILIVIVQEV